MSQLTGLDSILEKSVYRTTVKHKYSFGKSQRFSPNKSTFTIDYFDKPSMRSSRACSFGYGSKYYFNKPTNTPSGIQYTMPAQKLNGISFGIGRQKAINGSYLQQSSLNKGPPSNKYLPNLTITSKYKNASMYSIGRKHPIDSFILPSHTPEPTKYQTKIETNGRTTISNFKTSSKNSFPKSSRFLNNLYNPQLGPGKYHPNQSVDSKYITGKKNIFGMAAKTTFAEIAIKNSITPGPQYYIP